MDDKQFSHAVVNGAGVAGLMAAKVLSQYFENVTIIEKDNLPDRMGSRKGIPQGNHVHTLLEGGRRILEQYFPGFCDELIELGNVSINQTADTKWYHHGCWKTREAVDGTLNIQSRWHLEGLLRQKVREVKNIHWKAATVKGLEIENNSIRAVQTDNGTFETELYIDAAGRGSKLLNFLKDEGLRPPLTETLNVNLKYASHLYKRGEDTLPWQILVIYPDAPKGNRSAAVFPIIHEEHGQCWLLSLIGRNGDYPGSTHDDFLEFTKKLDQPDLHNLIKDKEPINESAAHFSFPCSKWNHFEKMKDLPVGILPLGDSYGHINPIYGQGMSIALIEANILNDCLKMGFPLKTTSRICLHRIGKFFKQPWLIANSEDWRYPQTENRPIGIKTLNKYSRKLHILSSVDKEVIGDMYDVLGFVKSPLILYKPKTMLKVLFKKVKK